MKKIVVMIFIIGVVVVFRTGIQSLIEPVFSKFTNNSEWIGIWVFLVSAITCCWVYYREKDRIDLRISGWKVETGLFILYIVYRFLYIDDIQGDKITFYSMFPDCWFSYIDEIWISIFVLEVCLAVRFTVHRPFKKTEDDNPVSKPHPFFMDSPTLKDDFGRREYALGLLNKIYETYSKIAKNRKASFIKCMDADENCQETDGAFVINISEKYGYGKSSFFLILKKQAQKGIKSNSLVLFEFKPWLCDTPQKIISEFFKLFGENLSKFIPDINKNLNKYVGLLLEYYSSKNAFSYLINSYRKEHSSILEKRKKLMEDIYRLERPVVILIDDVDRLHDDELMMLFSLLRNTADFPNLYYIMAVDVEYVKQVLKTKKIEDPDFYVKKFINVEFLLPGFDDDKMDSIFVEMLLDILKNYLKDEASAHKVEKSIDNIFGRKKKWSQVFTNIRDMKRFLNVYSLAIDFCININKEDQTDYTPEKNFDLTDLFAIELVKYLSEPIYRILRDRDDFILNLSKAGHRQQWYSLKAEYKSIVLGIFNDEAVERFVKEKNDNSSTKENKSSNSEEKENSSLDSGLIIDLLAKDKSKYEEETICYLLKYLFNCDSKELNVNSLRYKDAYFRYFAFRFHNTQMTVNEVFEMILESNIATYKKEIERVFKEKKHHSFIHKISFIENSGSLDINIVEKLFLFADEACKYYVSESWEDDAPEAKKEECICEEYNIFDILFYWYGKINYDGKNVEVEALNKNMSDFISKDPHLNLLFLFLKDMVYYNRKERLVFTNAELHNWCSLLLSRFFKEDPLNENSKIELRNILFRSMNVKPINVKWLASIIRSSEDHFTWNEEYIKYLFNTKNELNNFLPALENPEISDLRGLFKLEDISSCAIEEHLFLEMCAKVENKKLKIEYHHV